MADAADPLTKRHDVLTALGIGRGPNIAVEDRCWAETVLNIQNLRPDGTLSKASAVMMPLRRIKDEDELAIMRKAGVITEAAYAATLPQLRHGMTNLDLISEVKYQLKKHGAFTDSFVTSFYNMGKSYPFDFTNREKCCWCRWTRRSRSHSTSAQPTTATATTTALGLLASRMRKYRRCYNLVMQAQAAGIAALKAGNTCEEADAAARTSSPTAATATPSATGRVTPSAWMSTKAPFLTAGDTTVLQPGMCFTVEPSIFMPKHLGARVEDVVVIAPTAAPLTAVFTNCTSLRRALSPPVVEPTQLAAIFGRCGGQQKMKGGDQCLRRPSRLLRDNDAAMRERLRQVDEVGDVEREDHTSLGGGAMKLLHVAGIKRHPRTGRARDVVAMIHKGRAAGIYARRRRPGAVSGANWSLTMVASRSICRSTSAAWAR
ncbi:MAG: M24 family metallopeptidase [Caldilineaceae bacterium]